MANYPKELTDLLEEFLTDGVLTKDEEKALYYKCFKLKVDPEEFMLYAQAQIQKIDRAIENEQNSKKGAICPHCGVSVPLFTGECPNCGGFITPQATKQLEEIINDLEKSIVNFQSGKDTKESKAFAESCLRKAQLYYGNNPVVAQLISDVDSQIKKIEKDAKKENIIKILLGKKYFLAFVVFFLIALITSFFQDSIDDTHSTAREILDQIVTFSCCFSGGFGIYSLIQSKKFFNKD